MADFPTSLPGCKTDYDSSDPVASADQNDQSEEINAIGAKVGIDSSAVTTSHDYKLSGVTGTDKAVSKTGIETLTNKTLTSPVINTGVSGTAVLDEDNMASDSNTKVATQQSIKAYVDSGTVTMTNKTLDGAVVATSLDMNATELRLDADGDTSITADTDDRIDIKISGADDFRFTANTFTALSGSTIATNTIAETTAASGVTIDSLLIKDGSLSPTVPQALGKAVDITIANSGNDVGLTVTQNDVTNNPIAASITNAGSGNGLFIDQNGDGTGLYIDSEAATAGNYALYTLSAPSDGSYNVRFETEDSAATGRLSYATVLIKNSEIDGNHSRALRVEKMSTGTGHAVEIANYGTGDGIFINQDGAGIALNIDSEQANDGYIIKLVPAGATPGIGGFLRNDDVTGNIVLHLGGGYLWHDANGDLRTSATNPTNDTGGTVVGTQT